MGEEQWLRTTGTIRAGWEDGVCFVLQAENWDSDAPESLAGSRSPGMFLVACKGRMRRGLTA